MKMSEVLKLPFYITKSVSETGRFCIHNRDGFLICKTDTEEQAEAICLAVNSHDQLVEALRKIQRLTISGSGDKVICLAIIGEAQKISNEALEKYGDKEKE